MSDYKTGWRRGFEEGGNGAEIDAYQLSQYPDEDAVGYVMGFGESTFPGVPPDFRYRMIGELAATSGVPLSRFENAGRMTRNELDDFRKGFSGDDQEEQLSDDDDFND